ncbi:MAG: hypothetical protein IPH07_39405 [Deltaproteobacteria bacterium]|nr:hypothetical protein [Deltaproteobacteria bacterium]MBK8713899.1 hypothetical protein [Deltaproteobacteria bacterium]MBP7290568.1 hypothetical protein [Nannocystaceae bacterium]
MQVSEIGTKLTESTIVLHLQNIDASPLTPAWLQDKLGLRTDEQWTSLNAPGNDEFLAAMYDAKRADWNATVLRQLSDGSFEELPMAPAAELTPEQQVDLLLEGAVCNTPFPTWSLPKQDFIVPFSGTLLGQMCGLTRGESASCMTVSAERFEFPRDALDELAERVDALRKAIAARERRWRGYAKSIAAYHRVDGLCKLLERAYHHAARRPEDREEAELRAGQVADFRANLNGAYANVVQDAHRGEEALADAVLEALDDPGLVEAAEKLAFDPLSVDGDIAEEFATAVRYACEQLAMSVRVDALVRDHVWPALGAAAANEPYGFTEIVEQLKDAELRTELSGGWEKTFAEVQSYLGKKKKRGVVETLATAGKYYRSGPSIISNSLNEGVLLLVWEGLTDDPKARGGRLAGLLLRYVASIGLPDPGNARLMVAGRIDVGKLFHAFDELRGANTPAALEVRAKMIKNLKLKDQFARVPALQGLSIVAYVAAIWSVASNDHMDALQRGFTIASAVMGATESYAHIVVAIDAYFSRDVPIPETKFVANWIGRSAVCLGALASLIAFGRERDVASALSFGGGALRVEGYVFSIVAEELSEGLASLATSLRIAAGWLGFAGTLLGLAAMIWSLAEAPVPATVGVAALVSKPLEILFEIDSPFLLREADLRAALKRLPPRVLNVELVPVAGLWTNDQRVGTKMAWGDEEPPTYHAASMLGLVASEIATLFGVYESEVVRAGLPTALRGPRRPSVT